MTRKIEQIDTTDIVPGENDRTRFDADALAELASSIADHGLLQPITVRRVDDVLGPDPLFQIVAGERRFRAIRDVLGWETIDAIVEDLTEEEASAMMLTENVARDDLDPIDEGLAYAKRMERYGYSVETLAMKHGISPIRVQFRIKLLGLRPDIQKLVRDGHLPLGYAQALADANLDNNRQIIAIAHLRDNPAPTPAWFRRELGQLVQEQNQATLFDLPLMIGHLDDIAPIAPPPDPPLPSTDRPDGLTGQPLSVQIAYAIEYWDKAAQAWDLLGKNFKRDECAAARDALRQLEP